MQERVYIYSYVSTCIAFCVIAHNHIDIHAFARLYDTTLDYTNCHTYISHIFIHTNIQADRHNKYKLHVCIFGLYALAGARCVHIDVAHRIYSP